MYDDEVLAFEYLHLKRFLLATLLWFLAFIVSFL